jgi:hypothetical protein
MVRRVRKKRPGTKCSTILAILCLTTLPLTAQKMAPWLTRSADNARSGWNAQETKLKQASVSTKGIIRFTTIPVFGDSLVLLRQRYQSPSTVSTPPAAIQRLANPEGCTIRIRKATSSGLVLAYRRNGADKAALKARVALKTERNRIGVIFDGIGATTTRSANVADQGSLDHSDPTVGPKLTDWLVERDGLNS